MCTFFRRTDKRRILSRNRYNGGLQSSSVGCIIAFTEPFELDSEKNFFILKGESYEKIYCGNDGGYHAAGTCLHTCACTERLRRSIGCSTERSRRKHFSSLRRASILGLLTVRTVGQKAPTSKSAVPNPPSRQQSRRKRAISFPLTTKSAAKHVMTNSFSLSTATPLLQAPGLSSPAKLTGRM